MKGIGDYILLIGKTLWFANLFSAYSGKNLKKLKLKNI